MPSYKITLTQSLKPKFTIGKTLRLEHDPKEDEPWDDRPEEVVEINDPTPIPSNYDDRPEEVVEFKQKYPKQSYRMTSTIPTAKVKYNLAHNIDDIDERGVIEIPATNDTVIYQDEEGQYYEVPVSDLIDYDGDDGEITYHSKSLHKVSKKKKGKKVFRINLLPAMLYHQQQQRIRY